MGSKTLPKKKKISTCQNPSKCNQDLDWKTIEELRPRQTQYISKPSGGLRTKVCIRITLSVCACGAVIGFCLMVAGGVGKHHLGNIKVLMYIGILMFLVSVILIVILCSSYGIFNIYPAPQKNISQVPYCSYNDNIVKRCDIEKTSIPYQMEMVENPIHKMIPACSQCCANHLQFIPQPIYYIEGDVINTKKEEAQACTVKNCICQTKGVEINHAFTGEDIPEGRMDFPYAINTVMSPYSCCDQNRLISSSDHHFYQSPIDSKVHEFCQLPHNIAVNEIFSAKLEELTMQRYTHQQSSKTNETRNNPFRGVEESSKL